VLSWRCAARLIAKPSAGFEQHSMEMPEAVAFAVRLTDVADESIRKAVLDPLVAYNKRRLGGTTIGFW